VLESWSGVSQNCSSSRFAGEMDAAVGHPFVVRIPSWHLVCDYGEWVPVEGNAPDSVVSLRFDAGERVTLLALEYCNAGAAVMAVVGNVSCSGEKLVASCSCNAKMAAGEGMPACDNFVVGKVVVGGTEVRMDVAGVGSVGIGKNEETCLVALVGPSSLYLKCKHIILKTSQQICKRRN